MQAMKHVPLYFITITEWHCLWRIQRVLHTAHGTICIQYNNWPNMTLRQTLLRSENATLWGYSWSDISTDDKPSLRTYTWHMYSVAQQAINDCNHYRLMTEQALHITMSSSSEISISTKMGKTVQINNVQRSQITDLQQKQ